MKILVVSGFLGAGKTTFISHLIRSSGLKPVVLENEYGDDSLDSKELKKNEGLEVLEFMEGCVCCTKKDSFVNSLLAIHASLAPEYLIVEPSGIGRLSNIIENINKITFGDIELLNPIVVLSIHQMDAYIRDYPDIYIDQIKNAGTVVLSKIENESIESIRQAKERILGINDKVQIIDEPYQHADKAFFEELMDHENEAELIRSDLIGLTGIRQATFVNPDIINVNRLISILEGTLHNRFGNIVRAKGELMINDERIRFDLADGRYVITDAEDDGSDCRVVFIGKDINRNLLSGRLNVRNKKIGFTNLNRNDSFDRLICG